MQKNDIEEIKKLKDTFIKAGSILDNLIELEEKLQSKNKNEQEAEIKKEIDENMDLFLLQIIKISKFSSFNN